MAEQLLDRLPITDLAAGAAAGLLVETVGLHAFAHESLAHQNLEFTHPSLKALSRYGLIFCGLSPNRFALHHRRHHALTEVEPENVTGALLHTLDSGTGDDDAVDPTDPNLVFPGYSLEDDPLLAVKGGKVEFRDDSKLEAFVGKGDVRRFLPLIGALAGLGLANKLAGRERPLKRALAFGFSLMVGVTADSMLTSFAEGQAGVVNGKLDDQNVVAPLRKRTRRHQEHHSDPANPNLGAAPRHRTAFGLMQKAGLLRPIQPSKS